MSNLIKISKYILVTEFNLLSDRLESKLGKIGKLFGSQSNNDDFDIIFANYSTNMIPYIIRKEDKSL